MNLFKCLVNNFPQDDCETMLAKFAEAEKSQTSITEIRCEEPPSRRSALTITLHPDKEQIIVFGGEFYNGAESFVYNDLFFYTPKQDRWTQVKSPGK